MSDLDVLLITHNRPRYAALSLPRLLEGCPAGSRVWVWHNGDDQRVLEVIARHRDHPRFHRFHHSPDNVGLRDAMNWFWVEAEGQFLSKVDDDSLMEPGWIERLTTDLARSEEFGIFGSWRFLPEDFDNDLADPKIEHIHGVTLLRNHWVQGSGHIFRRDLVRELGPLRPGQSFPGWCLEAARHGYINGWPMPFVREEHLDDPRHPLTDFVDDAAFSANRPLSARATGIDTLAGWLQQTVEDARGVQRATLDLRHYFGWRRKLIHARRRARSLITGKADWNK